MAADKSSIEKDLAKQELGKAQASETEGLVSAKPESANGWRKLLAENLRLVTIALAIALSVRFFIAEPRYIPSPSMVPTLAVGDRLLVEKVSYRVRSPKRGEIVVFEPPPQLQSYGYSSQQAFIKRVVGLPGQTVQVTAGQVLIDGKPLKEPYIFEMPLYEMQPVKVPDNSLFMMGDNRNDSNDSHVWGFLPAENAIGRAVFRFWPLEKIGRIDQI
ncbi:MAG: signal peptidase I [Phormidesmis sp.]